MSEESSAAHVRNPVLVDLLAQVAAIRRDARELTQGLSPTQLNWRPDPSRWSILQCLEHLTRTVQLYPQRIETMLAESRQRAARGDRPYREGALMNWFVRGMEPPPKMRVRTMRSVDPPPDLDAARVLRDFDDAHALLASWITAADGVSLTHARTTSPFARLMRFTLGQVFALQTAHARRHLWQARQVREHPGFPAA